MNKVVIIIFICLFFTIIFVNCQRMPVPWFGFGMPLKIVSSKEEAFFDAVTGGKSIETIESFLKNGHDPDFMNARTAIPWHDNNPLWSVCNNYEKVELFIRYGADTKKRPYLYKITFYTPILSEKYPDMKLLENIRTRYENDVYKLVKLFLEAGASPNLKGAPNSVLFSFNKDKTYKEYFEKKGELPINSAIEDSAFTIVDLLLEYGAILDETSLSAAKNATKRIGNDDMERYIQAIWEKQQSSTRSENGKDNVSR
jgi:ankyrin repeat protein